MASGTQIRYIDFHSHQPAEESDVITVVNLIAGEDVPAEFPPNTLFSAGIHPWQLKDDNLEQLKTELILTAAHPHVVLLGEAGFDRMKGAQGEVQYEAFIFQASLAAEMHKPMIIHCVKGWDELLRAHKEMKPTVPWVIHGFRGDGRLASSLAGHGFWFSLGKRGITSEILNAVRPDRILLETDEDEWTIEDVYRLYAEAARCGTDDAVSLIKGNFNSLLNYNI